MEQRKAGNRRGLAKSCGVVGKRRNVQEVRWWQWCLGERREIWWWSGEWSRGRDRARKRQWFCEKKSRLGREKVLEWLSSLSGEFARIATLFESLILSDKSNKQDVTSWRRRSGKEQKVWPSSPASFGSCSILIDGRWIARQRGADVSPHLRRRAMLFVNGAELLPAVCVLVESKSPDVTPKLDAATTRFCESVASLNEALFDLYFFWNVACLWGLWCVG